MKHFVLFLLIFQLHIANGQVLLDADGPGDTYDLISSVLAPNHFPIEVPDCNHEEFGEHIDEIYNDELDAYVFRFHIHTAPDNDRCISFDRQRNEIKAYDKSPDNLLGVPNEKVIYKWKFKLEAGFQPSPNFTHLHQLKSVGGPYASQPMYTLTARKSNPDRIELRYAETDAQITLDQAELAPFIGTWLTVTEKIAYGENGSYEIEIKRVSDEEVLFDYSTNSIINWREDAEFVRPKWGIYRSLINEQDLRDETVLFANFSVEEVETLSSNDLSHDEITVSNPVSNSLFVKSLKRKIDAIQIYDMNGKLLLAQPVPSKTEIRIDISTLPKGTLILNVKGEGLKASKVIVVI